MLTRIAGFGTRARLDTGTLGVSAVELRGAADVARLLAAEAAGRVRRFRGYTEFASATLTVESDRRVEAGIDGEAVLLDPPLEFRSLPGVLRVRIPTHAPGLLTGGAGATVDVVDAAGAVPDRRRTGHADRRDAAIGAARSVAAERGRSPC